MRGAKAESLTNELRWNAERNRDGVDVRLISHVGYISNGSCQIRVSGNFRHPSPAQKIPNITTSHTPSCFPQYRWRVNPDGGFLDPTELLFRLPYHFLQFLFYICGLQLSSPRHLLNICLLFPRLPSSSRHDMFFLGSSINWRQSILDIRNWSFCTIILPVNSFLS